MATEPNLLLVDDDTTFTRHLGRALRERGYRVATAANYERALEVAAATVLDYAVVDLRLQSESGLDVVRDLLRVNPLTKIVVLTGYGSIATAVRCVRLGAVDYLTKPANADDVVAALQHSADPLATRDTNEPPPSLAQAEWEHIQRVLADCGGNITHAAERLGLHRRSLQRKLARPPK